MLSFVSSCAEPPEQPEEEQLMEVIRADKVGDEHDICVCLAIYFFGCCDRQLRAPKVICLPATSNSRLLVYLKINSSSSNSSNRHSSSGLGEGRREKLICKQARWSSLLMMPPALVVRQTTRAEKLAEYSMFVPLANQSKVTKSSERIRHTRLCALQPERYR